MKTLKRLAIICVAAVWATSAAAQAKIGIIDLRKVFEEYHKTKTINARLADQAADLEKESTTLKTQYQKAVEDYKSALESANDQAVSADEREKRKKSAESKLLDVKKLEQDIGTFDRQARTTLEEEQRKYRDKIIAEIRNVINTKAKNAGYSLVLDVAAESFNKTAVVLYSTGENDLTTAVLTELNANAPPPTPGSPAPKPTEKK